MKQVSIICVNENSTLETIALRGALEYFGYTPTVHWLGSIDHFKEIVSGKVALNPIVILSCHGSEEGFYGTDNATIPLNDLDISLKDKIVLSLGCVTGSEKFGKAFLRGGSSVYIAPPSYPEGNSSLVFAIIFLWKLQLMADAKKSWKDASALLTEKDDQFKYYS